MGLGYVEGVTNDYIRHGPTTQFAAPSPAPGVPELPAKDRQRGAQGAQSVPDSRQLLQPQARLAGAAVPHPLPTHLCLLAYGGGLLWRAPAEQLYLN